VFRAYTTTCTRTELEEAFLRLCDDHGLPRPEVNIETDRKRDVELTVAGWTVLGFTCEPVVHRPGWVARAIRLAWRSA
jgi:hypothetical protein